MGRAIVRVSRAILP